MTVLDQRGFVEFGEFSDTYGARVRVKQSSSWEPRVWVFITGGSVTTNDGSAHLSREQAVKLRDLLSDAIDALATPEDR